MARLQPGHHPGRVSRPDQRFVFQVSHVPHPVKTIFYLPMAPDPGGQGGRVDVFVAGDQVDDLDGLRPVLRDGAAQLRDLGGAVEPGPGRRERRLDGAAGPAAVVLAHGGDGGDCGPGKLLELRVQAGHVGLDQEGDRLRRFRALLPCEVVVTAVTHPLHGCRLRAYAVRHVDGVPHLKVELPDGMPGLVAVEATDALGAEAAGAGEGLVLDGDGLRRLRAVVMRLRDGDASGPRR